MVESAGLSGPGLPAQGEWWLFGLHWLAATLVAGHVLLFKTNSRAALGWLVAVYFLPVFGILVYWSFGINRVWHRPNGSQAPRWSDQGALPRRCEHEANRLTPIARVGAQVTGKALSQGNRVSMLVNGEQAFPEMLRAIHSAEQEVLLSSYIFDTDASGQSFVAALTAACRRGVSVRVLLDDFGRRSSFPSVLGRLRRAGLEVRVFMPLRGLLPGISINLRNHRKLLIVDRRVAFAGGMNIGDRQLVTGGSPRRAQDLHFRVVGPIVAQLSALFATDWRRSGGGPLLPIELAPQPCPPSGRSACRVVADGPDEQIDQLALTIEGVISSALSRVLIVTPYFLPEQRLAGALQSAALRGVAVTVLIPAHCNWPFVRWALNHRVYELLNTGVRVMERPGVFAHSKCMIVDDSYALIGSHNLDARSLRLNFEMGMEIFDPEFVEEAMAHIEANALSDAVLVTAQQIAGRRVPVRIRDALAALFAPYL